jgi:hypothetical protein
MAQSELGAVIEEYHRTIDAIVIGDPEPQKRLWSRGDDVTLANPLGPPVRGWPGRGAFGTGSVDGPRGRASPVRKHF